MDLLKSLIVPPAEVAGVADTIGAQRSARPYLGHDTPLQGTSSASSVEPKVCLAGSQESGNARTRRRKRNKQKQKQQKREEKQQPQSNVNRSRTPAVSGPTKPAGASRARKRNKYQLFHPDRPKRHASGRLPVSYEDLYDDNPAQQQADSSPPNTETRVPSKSNPASSQTCFFWYHGSCKREQDRRGCSLRHALLDPPSMIAAPPGFVHPTACTLEWCAGDGETKGQKARVSAEEQKRYFEAVIADDESDGESGDETAEEEMDFFLEGFDGIGA